MQVPAVVVLSGGPEAVPQARAFAAAALPKDAADVISDAALVVTELVTNAVLHGTPPITVRVQRSSTGVRIEVEDAGRSLPVKPARRADAMTGRGLELVAALSDDWGVTPSAGGKTVWAEIGMTHAAGAARLRQSAGSHDAFPDVDDLLAAWQDEPAAERRYPVRLGAVPTDLLLAAKTHIDNVVRELTLARAEEATTGVRLPQPMHALINAVLHEFAEARTSIKRQALEGSARGEPVVNLVLELPLSAADAGERYLAALDEADRHARAARLLTLAPPQSHRAFRQWYVQSLVDQLRAAARGDTPPAPKPFPQVLADEVDRLSALEESWERLQLLQNVTAELTGATAINDIAHTVVTRAGTYPGVETARVFVVTERRTLRSIAHTGGEDVANAEQYDEFPLDADLPGAIVARTGQPLFIRSLRELTERFPELAGYYPTDRSLHIVPLTVGGHISGVLSLTFLGGEVPDDAQVTFVRAIGDLLAQAIERANAIERAAADRQRDLRLLSAQLDVLTGIVAGDELSDAIGALLVDVESAARDGMLASVLLLDRDGTHLRHCAAPSLPTFYNEAIDGVAIGPSVGSCGTAAYRQAQVIVEDISSDPLWADYRELAAAAQLRACWSTPIFGTGRELLGTFAMYYPQPQRPSGSDLALIDVLVRTVAMAIERSRADEEREEELAAERESALTLQHHLLPAVPPAVGPVALDARYRTGDPGVEVGGDWFDAIAVNDSVVVVVGDVQGHDLGAASLMGQLRTLARARAGEGFGPAAILAGLNRYLERLGTELLTTAVVVQIDLTSGRSVVASAGHLPPVLIVPNATGWQASDLPIEVGPPLGLGSEWAERVTALPAGGLLLLYTDGLVETRSWPLEHGLMLLHKTLEAMPAGAQLPTFLDAALELVPTGSRGDDVAILGVLLPDAS